MTGYLNGRNVDFISVSYDKIDDSTGRHHEYCIRTFDSECLRGLHFDKWLKKGAQFIQENDYGVLFSLNPSMSWQIWWRIPLGITNEIDKFLIE